jgi:hypothetical protein
MLCVVVVVVVEIVVVYHFFPLGTQGNCETSLSGCVARQTLNLGPCLPTFSASSKTVPFGLPLLLVPCEFQSSACFSMDSSSFLRVLPIYQHFLILICN